jgi:hypothetical protein
MLFKLELNMFFPPPNPMVYLRAFGIAFAAGCAFSAGVQAYVSRVRRHSAAQRD